MRLMLERFSGERGFLGPDIERTIEDVCGCDVTPLFDANVRGASPIDFDRYLGLIGLRSRVTWTPALDRAGKPAVELRVWAYNADDGSLRLRIGSPEECLGQGRSPHRRSHRLGERRGGEVLARVPLGADQGPHRRHDAGRGEPAGRTVHGHGGGGGI